jgi:predicted nucleic acid-binding protein
MEQWIRMGVRIVVPALWDYEVISALRKLWTQSQLSRERAVQGLERIYRLPVQRIQVDRGLSIAALLWADRLGQLVAYDSQYLTLAEHLNAPFFTSDRKLYKRCKEIKADFVNLLE